MFSRGELLVRVQNLSGPAADEGDTSVGRLTALQSQRWPLGQGLLLISANMVLRKMDVVSFGLIRAYGPEKILVMCQPHLAQEAFRVVGFS